eukprot:1127849-Pelagomonas_calceolata.AAC.1
MLVWQSCGCWLCAECLQFLPAVNVGVAVLWTLAMRKVAAAPAGCECRCGVCRCLKGTLNMQKCSSCTSDHGWIHHISSHMRPHLTWLLLSSWDFLGSQAVCVAEAQQQRRQRYP